MHAHAQTGGKGAMWGDMQRVEGSPLEIHRVGRALLALNNVGEDGLWRMFSARTAMPIEAAKRHFAGILPAGLRMLLALMVVDVEFASGVHPSHLTSGRSLQQISRCIRSYSSALGELSIHQLREVVAGLLHADALEIEQRKPRATPEDLRQLACYLRCIPQLD